MAAADAAVRPWPSTTLDALLHYMVKHYRPELLTLLHKPLIRAFQNSSIVAQQEPLTQQNQHLNPDRHQRQRQLRAAAEAMFRVLQAEAVIEFPEMLGDLLLVLAQQVKLQYVQPVHNQFVKKGAAINHEKEATRHPCINQ